MKGRPERVFVPLLIAFDVAMIGLALVAAYYLRFRAGVLPEPLSQPGWQNYVWLIAVLSLVLPPTFAAQGLYRVKRNVSRIDELYRVFAATSIAVALSTAVSAIFFRDYDYSRAVLAMTWLLAILFIWTARLIQFQLHAYLRRQGYGEERVLIVGTGEMARIILQKILASPSLGYRPVGFVDEALEPGRESIDGYPILGESGKIGWIVEMYQITEVIVADSSLPHQRIMEIMALCDRSNVSIKVFPDVFQILVSEAAIGDLNGMPMVSVRDAALQGWNAAVKRAMDLFFSALVLILLSPLILLTAAAIKLTSPDGPIFYFQERVGLDGRRIWVIKFRSMRPDAEAQTGPIWAKRGDPRTTPIGRFLRRFSIDELPQFVNVLLGDMSIVGPRPERPVFVEQFSQQIQRYPERHKEKAGLTGWAQVNGLRGNTSIEERTAYDLWYVENWTPWLDIKIMVRTVLAIFRDRNAY